MDHAHGVSERVERRVTPRGEVQLQRRGDHFEVISNGLFLMATYNGRSERALVRFALAAARHADSVLIGGLGVGYSLAEALATPAVKRVVVVEIEQAIVHWQQEHFSRFTGPVLDDGRVAVVVADIVEWIDGNSDYFDAICLDVDNGPDWLVADENGRLYGEDGLRKLGVLLAPDGVLAFWSARRSVAFAAALRRRFERVEEHAVDAERDGMDAGSHEVDVGLHGVVARRDEPDYIYLASRPAHEGRVER